MQKYLLRLRNLLKNPCRINPKTSEAFWNMKKDIKNILNKYYLFIIGFFIAVAFIKLFLLFQEPDYEGIIDYGERGTILIATLAILTFTYACALDPPEKQNVTKIGKLFLKSVLNFVIGLIFLIGFRDALNKPHDLSVFPGILLRLFPDILVYLSLIIMYILFLTGFVMLITSAVYLGKGIYYLTK